MNEQFEKAYLELGEEEFNKHYREVFNIPCLDFVKTIVINLPESCYSNCEYCIDKYLRQNVINNKDFLEICEKVLQEFPNTKSVSITGGTLNPNDFNKLVNLIEKHLPNSSISWNTNGVLINEEYLKGISKIKRINLHRNSTNEKINRSIFKTNKRIISIDEAKKLMGEKLFLRVTIDETFNLDEYAKLGVPLYLNRLLPGTEETDKIFNDTINKLNISNEIDKRRRNIYLTGIYNDIPIRICLGDKLATHIPGRQPTYLNVAIIHRSGIVCGSWYEDDKVIYNPYNKKLNNSHYTRKKILVEK